MKRMHLFEFEDLAWFPNWLRVCMTRYLLSIHKILGTADMLAELLDRVVAETNQSKIIDLCSGSGGPMLDVMGILKSKHNLDPKLTLSDLYPNLKAAKGIADLADPAISYSTQPVDATDVSADTNGIRTMICSMHHMTPDVAKDILADAKEARQPICVFEISDNSTPKWIWWLAIPINLIAVFFITPFVRPMSWQQLVFTYIIPALPLFIAWDGAVSNARTYTLNDLDILLEGLHSEDYIWEKSTIKGKGGNKIYLLGLPK